MMRIILAACYCTSTLQIDVGAPMPANPRFQGLSAHLAGPPIIQVQRHLPPPQASAGSTADGFPGPRIRSVPGDSRAFLDGQTSQTKANRLFSQARACSCVDCECGCLETGRCDCPHARGVASSLAGQPLAIGPPPAIFLPPPRPPAIFLPPPRTTFFSPATMPATYYSSGVRAAGRSCPD